MSWARFPGLCALAAAAVPILGFVLMLADISSWLMLGFALAAAPLVVGGAGYGRYVRKR